MASGTEFYSTAAQVIPVLLLALIFERRGQVVEPEYERALRRSVRDADEDEAAAIEAAISGIPPDSSNLGAAMPTSEVVQHTIAGELRATIQRSRAIASALSTVAILILVAGESLALSVTVSGDATTWREFGVGGAMVVGVALILWPLLLGYIERIAAVWPWLDRHTYAAGWILLCSIFIVAAIWW